MLCNVFNTKFMFSVFLVAIPNTWIVIKTNGFVHLFMMPYINYQNAFLLPIVNIYQQSPVVRYIIRLSTFNSHFIYQQLFFVFIIQIEQNSKFNLVIIALYLAGFRKKYSTVDHIFSFKLLVDFHLSANKELHAR